MSTRRSIEKERMKFAYDYVNGKELKEEAAKKFESYVQKVPAFILTNGLGNTMAFLTTKNDEQWKNVKEVVANWLWRVEGPVKSRFQRPPSFVDILDKLKDDDFEDIEYRAVMVEVLALFNWLRRFAKANRIAIESK